VGVSRGLGAGGWRERRPGEPWVDGNLGRHLAGTASGTRSPCRARERTALESSDGLGGGEGVLWERCEGVRLLGVPFIASGGSGKRVGAVALANPRTRAYVRALGLGDVGGHTSASSGL
jgi:hypothetical protein